MATRKGFCPHHPNRKVEKGYTYCFACRTRVRNCRERFKAEHNLEYRVKQRLRRHKMELARREQGLCKRCGKAPATPIECASCMKRHTDYQYKKRGKFTPRRAETSAAVNRFTLARMQYELSDNWPEARDWVKAHIDVFNEASDRVLYMSRPFMPKEDFACES